MFSFGGYEHLAHILAFVLEFHLIFSASDVCHLDMVFLAIVSLEINEGDKKSDIAPAYGIV